MADYSAKLASLKNRRQGWDAPYALAINNAVEFREAEPVVEAYERRSTSQAVKYAVGAMAELDPEYTRISFEEGDRIRNQLESGLRQEGIPATFDYQGSVPLNIHIRKASDIDLLVLHSGFVTVDALGPRASGYVTLKGSVLEDMSRLRRYSEGILRAKFPAADVDCTGAKSIALSGGSLRRKVDVVPSHWHDTATYQQSKEKHDREVRVFDKRNWCTISNRPFLHIKRIEDKDSACGGGAKKVIRLLKNLRKDASAEIGLSSYDIAALVWHFDVGALTKPYYYDLALVAETQRQLEFFVSSPAYTRMLEVPDGSRKIIDVGEKLKALALLKGEVDELASDIAKDLGLAYVTTLESVRKKLTEAVVY